MSIQHSTIDWSKNEIHLHPDAMPRVRAILRNDPCAIATHTDYDGTTFKFSHIDAGPTLGGVIRLTFEDMLHFDKVPVFRAPSNAILGAFWDYLYRRYFNKINENDALSMALNTPILPISTMEK